MRTLLLVILISATGRCEPHFVKDISPEREAKARLHDDLTNHRVLVNKLCPLSADGEIDVEFNIWVDKVTQVVEAEQRVQLSVHLSMFWKDENLAWDKEYYGNVSSVNLPPNVIWHPLIYVSNSADSSWRDLGKPFGIKLKSTGNIFTSSFAFITTHCNFDLTYYPFDIQNCTLVIVYEGQDAVIRPTKIDVDDQRLKNISSLFNTNWEWTIESRVVRLYRYTDFGIIELAFQVRRATMYYYLCVLMPMIATSMLTLLVFWIPPASGEKMSYLVSIYVSTALFLNFVGDTLPRNMSKSNTPRMTLFLVFVIAECIVALVATTFVMRRHQQEKETDGRKSQDDGDHGFKGDLIQPIDTRESSIHKDQDAAGGRGSKHLSKLANICRGGRAAGAESQQREKLMRTRYVLSATDFDTIFFWFFLVTCVVFYGLVFVV